MFCESRTRKKKGLTSLVEIVPFLGQTLRAKTPQQQEKKVYKPTAPQLKKQAKTLSKPVGKLNSTNLSISGVIHQHQNSVENQDVENLPKTPFTKDQLLEAWKIYAYQLRKEGKESLFSMLVNNAPELKAENHIHFQIASNLLREGLERIKSDLLAHVRKSLNNWSIQFTYEVEENVNDQKDSLYSSKSKFKKMSEDNPSLLKMQKLFNLDIDM